MTMVVVTIMLLWDNAHGYLQVQITTFSHTRFTHFESTENSSCKFLFSFPWMTELKYSSRIGMNGKTSSIPLDPLHGDPEVESRICCSFSWNKLALCSPESSSIVSQVRESRSMSISSSSSACVLPFSSSCAHSKLMTISIMQLHTFWLTPREKRQQKT